MNDLPKIPVEAKEIIKHKRTGKIYASKDEFDADVSDPNTDTTADDFRQDLEIRVTRAGVMGVKTKTRETVDGHRKAATGDRSRRRKRK